MAILGAGISGLSLGWLFSRIGKRVTLLESTDRIGGLARIFSPRGTIPFARLDVRRAR
ncbi:NAD(P)-binding protein [Thiocapsa bogorovii]|uniref:NAD(P)-binding protein n=1 Tax=Thiocapsa bogorovii TaxID=521689 RepID=UPI0038CDC894